jgi:hypothetical protein
MKLKEMKATGVIVNNEEDYDWLYETLRSGHFYMSAIPTPRGTCYKFPFSVGISKVATWATTTNWYKKNITLAEFKKEQGIMKYKQGDVLIHNCGRTCEIQGAVGTVYIVENSNGDGVTWTEKEIEQYNYTLKTDEPEITELTLEDIAALKGIPVEQLRIKE